MAKQLPDSIIERKNVLNNPFAIEYIQKEVGIKGLNFEGGYKYTIEQVASFFEVNPKTIRRYIAEYISELGENGYEVLVGIRLKMFKKMFVKDINVPHRAVNLGVFSFKALLNLGMLLAESERARLLRSLILDIVIDVVSKKAGGSTKYINQRDEGYLMTLYVGENYRKDFIDTLKDYVEMGNFKYATYTNKIYKSIFKEHAREYRQILSLTGKENVRDTMYSEVLTTISMYETGLAHEIKKESDKLSRKLTPKEVDKIFIDFESNPAWKPQIEVARRRMASRDYGLRFVTHPELTSYISPLDKDDFERFLGEKSAELSKRIKQYQNVFKRLKDK